jgi:hypothetical protein
VHNVSDVRQIELHTAEPLVPGPRCVEVDIVIAKMKKYKSPGSDEIPAELIQAGNETLLSVIHKLINSVWNKEKCLISGRSLLLYQFTKRVTKMTNNYCGISLLSTSYKILSNILLSRLSPYIDEIVGIISDGFDVTDQLLIRFSAFVKYWRINGSTVIQYISYS